MAQIKPFYCGFNRFQRVYGLREKDAISCRDNRPFYRGMYFMDGVNTHYLWDREGRYINRRIKGTRKI